MPPSRDQAPAGPPWRYMIDGARSSASTRRLRARADQPPNPASRLCMSFFTRLVFVVMRLRFRVEIEGAFPAAGCVAVSLHDSYWDGPLVAALDPRVAPVTSKRWRRIPLVGWLLDVYGVIWTGESVIEQSVDVARRGSVCWVAPYGFDRGGPRRQPHPGAAVIAIDSGRPIVPLKLTGLRRSARARRPRSPVRVEIGEPLHPAEGESVEDLTARCEAQLREG